MNQLTFVLFLSLFSLLLIPEDIKCQTTAAIPPYKQKTINKIKNYISAFLTDSQLSSLCDLILAGFLAGKTTTEMANDAMNTVMNSLTMTQMQTGLGLMSGITKDFGSLDGAMAFMSPVATIAGNNLTPFMKQVTAKVNSMKAKGKGTTATTLQMYHMMNEFFTQKRCQTILQRVKTNSMSPGNWTLFQKNLNSIVFFSKYNLT
uniref:Uncharacterized protein n=1 Tax=Ditylenchus dipsaci TaxID=166011 RepID=A0A915DLA0_9BILA